MKPNSTQITVLLDRSGSMAACKEDMEGGFRSYLAELRKQDGEAYVSLHQFDTDYETVYESATLECAQDFTLVPRGGTALLDAMGKCVRETGERLAKLTEADRPERVIFITITDGGENASKEITREALRKMIEHQQNKYQWEFVYLGANQDSFTEAGAIGINRLNTANYAQTAAGIGSAFMGVARSTNNYRAGGSAALNPDDIQS